MEPINKIASCILIFGYFVLWYGAVYLDTENTLSVRVATTGIMLLFAGSVVFIASQKDDTK